MSESKSKEEFEKAVNDMIECARWQGEVSGKVEGALNVLFALDLDKEKRIELLQNAVGLSHITASEFIAPRQIEENIYKSKMLTDDEKDSLSNLMTNEAMDDEKVLDHPVEMLKFLTSMSEEIMIEKCIPQVENWVKCGEDVSLHRVKEWLIEKYQLL